MRLFETFRPNYELLKKHISYYYLDLADGEQYSNEYICYPHFNNTISIYASHLADMEDGQTQISFAAGANPLQIFTPIRAQQLKVSQLGPVYKLGIVFEPLGVNQFLPANFRMNERCVLNDFFEAGAISKIFNTMDISEQINEIDQQLLKLYSPVSNAYLSKAIQLFHQAESDLNVDGIASLKLGIGRKQFNRIFQKYLGISPQKYRSIVRFRQLMNHKLQPQTKNNYSVLSHQAHYTDQSHFIKACKLLTGLTPSQFFNDGRIVGKEDTFWKFTG